MTSGAQALSSQNQRECIYHQLMRGEFLETVLYWAVVASVCLCAIAEKKVSQVSQHSCVWSSVGLTASTLSERADPDGNKYMNVNHSLVLPVERKH